MVLADYNNVVLEDAGDDESIDTDNQELFNHNGTSSSSASYSSSDRDFTNNVGFKETATTDNQDAVTAYNEDSTTAENSSTADNQDTTSYR